MWWIEMQREMKNSSVYTSVLYQLWYNVNWRELEEGGEGRRGWRGGEGVEGEKGGGESVNVMNWNAERN